MLGSLTLSFFFSFLVADLPLSCMSFSISLFNSLEFWSLLFKTSFFTLDFTLLIWKLWLSVSSGHVHRLKNKLPGNKLLQIWPFYLLCNQTPHHYPVLELKVWLIKSSTDQIWIVKNGIEIKFWTEVTVPTIMNNKHLIF